MPCNGTRAEGGSGTSALHHVPQPQTHSKPQAASPMFVPSFRNPCVVHGGACCIVCVMHLRSGGGMRVKHKCSVPMSSLMTIASGHAVCLCFPVVLQSLHALAQLCAVFHEADRLHRGQHHRSDRQHANGVAQQGDQGLPCQDRRQAGAHAAQLLRQGAQSCNGCNSACSSM